MSSTQESGKIFLQIPDAFCDISEMRFMIKIRWVNRFNHKGVLNKPLTPDEGPSLETSIFPLSVSGSERTFTFRVSLNTLPTLATLVRDTKQKSRSILDLNWSETTSRCCLV